MIGNEDEAQAYLATLCDSEAYARLERLIALLREENTRQNLVSRGSLEQVWQRHIADSAQLLEHVPRETSVPSWLDIGTGAGFPGLVISALRPGWPVTLVESRKRRAEWLNSAIAELGLANCEVQGTRLEDVPAFEAGIISARAFAPLDKLLALARRFSTTRTLWLLPKGRSAAQEVEDLPKTLQNGFHVEQSLTDPDAGIIVGGIMEGRDR